MKRTIIGAAFFIGGAMLIGAGGGLALFGAITGFFGMVILVFELLTKEK